MSTNSIVWCVIVMWLGLFAAACFAESHYRGEVSAEALSLLSCEEAREECLRTLIAETGMVSEFLYYCQMSRQSGTMGRVRYAPAFRHFNEPIQESCTVLRNDQGPALSYGVGCRASLFCL